MTSDHLACPECGEPAIPASGFSHAQIGYGPTWCEDDEATCPGCGLRLRANMTGDGDGCEYMVAIVMEDYADDLRDRKSPGR